MLAISTDFAISTTKKFKTPMFRVKEYEGHPSRGIISIFFKGNARHRGQVFDEFTLVCYGTLIHSEYVVVPCSCVSEPENRDTSIPTAFDHKDPGKVKTIEPYLLLITLMWYEKSIKKVDPVKDITFAKQIDLSPQCDTSFQVNVAVITLGHVLHYHKLVWVHTSDRVEMKRDLMEIAVANAVTDRCHIFRWGSKPTALTFANKYRIDGKQMIQKRVVRFKSWSSCMENVCPSFVPHGVHQGKYDLKICQNFELRGTRFCVTWEEDDLICKITPGTPVFCYIGDFQGVVGFLHNDTMFCPKDYAGNAIMEGYDDALDLVQKYLPIHYAPNYRHGVLE
ncbi:hypothetical protein GE061_007976 [Apolygus lucorum]|uniref:Peptidase S1 domain-containing protein n=1 Tax=Apolygus lucorum TaxID=248454 RepID=A0A8S9WPX1_APOLU|nr:hypothetical protein GE061_007976 [Apolygus lucorum]